MHTPENRTWTYYEVRGFSGEQELGAPLWSGNDRESAEDQAYRESANFARTEVWRVTTTEEFVTVNLRLPSIPGVDEAK